MGDQSEVISLEWIGDQSGPYFCSYDRVRLTEPLLADIGTTPEVFSAQKSTALQYKQLKNSPGSVLDDLISTTDLFMILLYWRNVHDYHYIYNVLLISIAED